MHTQDKERTKRNLVIFIVSVLGSAALAGVIEPLTVPPGADPCTSGLGQLLWIIAPLGVMLLLRIFGGDGWADFGLRPNFKGNGFWWLVSGLVFPVVITISVLLGALLGGLELDVNMLSAFVAALLPGLISAAAEIPNRVAKEPPARPIKKARRETSARCQSCSEAVMSGRTFSTGLCRIYDPPVGSPPQQRKSSIKPAS